MKFVYTSKAPAPIGPYSQAVKVADFIFCSGQIPIDPQSSQIVGLDIETQSHQVFKNIQAVLSAERLTLNDVVKTIIFLTDITEFSVVNEIYKSYFKGHKPARSCIEVSALPKQVKIEIEVIAYKASKKPN